MSVDFANPGPDQQHVMQEMQRGFNRQCEECDRVCLDEEGGECEKLAAKDAEMAVLVGALEDIAKTKTSVREMVASVDGYEKNMELQGAAWRDSVRIAKDVLPSAPEAAKKLLAVAKPTTTRGMVEEYLKTHGYDGLYAEDECACLLDDLCPCGDIQSACLGGYKNTCPGTCGEHDFHVGPDRL